MDYDDYDDDEVELYCTEEDGEWIVWFPHPLGGKYVLETFDNEASARAYWQEQVDSADFGE